MQYEDFKHVMDFRGFMELGDPRLWRIKLRRNLYDTRKGQSDLTKRTLNTFDMHEGLYSRKYLPPHRGQVLLMSGINCFLLLPAEHTPQPPTRPECYWISVARYGKNLVDSWVDSLPFKSRPDKPWAGTLGSEVLYRISQKYTIDSSWWDWYNSVVRKVDVIA